VNVEVYDPKAIFSFFLVSFDTSTLLLLVVGKGSKTYASLHQEKTEIGNTSDRRSESLSLNLN
jgi:hypothetical protein